MSGGRGGRGGGPPGPAAGAGYYNGGGGYGGPPGGYPGLNEIPLILFRTSCVNVVNWASCHFD